MTLSFSSTLPSLPLIALVEMKQRHLSSIKALQEKALERIGTIEAKDLPPADALKWLEANVRRERLSHKLPHKYDRG